MSSEEKYRSWRRLNFLGTEEERGDRDEDRSSRRGKVTHDE
jgi:hypothetical protein